MLIPLAASAQQDQAALIAQLQQQIAALQVQLLALMGGSSVPSAAGECSFTRNLTVGVRGDDVVCLQEMLISEGHLAAGLNTGYFGNLTKAAVAKWQAANGVAPAAGYFGSISRAKYSEVAVVVPPPPPPPPPPSTGDTGTGTTITPPPATGGGVTVAAAADQPANSLAPANSVQVPFTKFTLTAGAEEVTVTGVVVERTGLGIDSNFAGVVLLDDKGAQIDLEKTLNSEHKTTVGGTFKVPAGTTKVYTVAGNMGTTQAGQVLSLSVVEVKTTATVSGTLPITGASHSANASLTIGTVTMQRGSLDPGAVATKEVGTTGYTFSSIKATAGSAEKVYLKSVRWNQIGSAGSGDLANLKTYVDGTAYDVAVSSDGKYYTTTFADNNGKGLLMDKGFSKELTIKGDVVGGSARTIAFDIAKRTDIVLIGETYGFGIKAPQTNSCGGTSGTSCFTSSENPWYDGAQVLVSAGTINVTSSNVLPSQNIAVNVSNAPLGAFEVNVKGESITVGSLVVSFNTTGTTADVGDITNISILDGTGAIVAGPVDGVSTNGTSDHGTATFSSTITFPVGINAYKVVGKVGTVFSNNATIIASTTPGTQWTTVRGVTTGNTITPTPSTGVGMNTMTVKGSALNVSVSSVPRAQTVISGTKAFLFANYVLDASGSGEDLRVTSIPLEFNVGAGSATDLTNCQLWDGSTSVTSGSNIKNPSGAASGTSFTFDGNGLSIAKGTSKTLAMKCDVGGGLTTGSYLWGLDSGQQANYAGVSGMTSGSSTNEVLSDSAGQTMTIATGGTITVALDANSPPYKLVGAGQTGIELARLRFSATNEDIDIKQVALSLNGVASNTPQDLVGTKVSLWIGSKQVGEAVFSTGDHATSSLIASGDFRVPRDGSKVLIVKGDIANVSNSGPLTQSGDLLIVDYAHSNVGLNGNYGTGVSSGATINGSATDTTSPAGMRIMKAYPSFTHIPLTSSEKLLSGGTNSNHIAYKFSVKANNGDVYLYKLSFAMGSSTLSGSTATTSAFRLYAYTDSGYSNTDTTFASSGYINAGGCYNGSNVSLTVNARTVEIYPDRGTAECSATTTYVVPDGETRYFELRANFTNISSVSTSKDTITAQLSGDATYHDAVPTGFVVTDSANMQQVGIINTDADNNFIWSPNSTSTSQSIEDQDFTNGFQVPGLPATGMNQEALQN